MDYQINYGKYQNSEDELRKLWEAAHLDALTRLYNRYGMEEWITQELTKLADTDVAALLIIDVDNFKQVNDCYGHMLGDAVLVEIAKAMKIIFHDQYFCGRVGGDEYQIFAPKITTKQSINILADELCHLINDTYKKENNQYDISLSIGISFTSERTREFAELYKEADLALYQAKKLGKNQYAVYQDNYQKVFKQKPREERAQGLVEQIGESGFSSSKVMLDKVIRILKEHEDPKTAIEMICKVIVDTMDVTRAYASCYTEDEMHIGASYFYAQDSDKNIRPNMPFSGKEYEARCFNKDSVFFCTDIEKVQEPMRTELKRMGVQTLLQVLIHKDGKIIGTLGINNCGYKRLWLQNEIEVIHTIAQLLEKYIYRLQQESKME